MAEPRTIKPCGVCGKKAIYYLGTQFMCSDHRFHTKERMALSRERRVAQEYEADLVADDRREMSRDRLKALRRRRA
jgi:hypothetical protein